MNVFQLNEDEKLKISEKLSNSFKKEFNFESKHYSRQLNDLYRKFRGDIKDHIQTRNSFSKPYLELLKKRENAFNNIINAYDILDREREDFVCNMMHMTMNRWFKSQNRHYEMIIYTILYKYLLEQKAQKKTEECK